MIFIPFIIILYIDNDKDIYQDKDNDKDKDKKI